MSHKNIKTVAGCLTRVTCDITAPEGTDTTLSAYLVYEDESRPATLESAGVIIFPAVPYGHYAYEVRCGGKPVAFGHLLVRPSAFPHTDGVVDYTLAADLTTTDAALVEITIAPGPRGPQGEKGEQGEPLTYADLTEEQKEELIGPLGYAEVDVAPEGTTEDNYNAYGFGFEMPRAGRIKGLTLECRDAGTATPENTPVWLKVWRGTTLIARSANAQQHAVDAVLSYTFAEPFAVAEGEEIKVSFHAEEGLAETGYYMGRQCCLRVVAKDPATTGGLLGDQGGYGAASDTTQRSWVAKHTWHMQVGVFAPAEHATDTTAHITAAERAAWNAAAANEGVSGDDLVELAGLDEWEEENQGKTLMFGSVSGQGSPTGQAVPATAGLTFTYSTTDTISANRIQIYATADDVPVVSVNGNLCALKSIAYENSWVLLEYEFGEFMLNPETTIEIRGANTVRGGESTPSGTELLSGSINGVYPFALLYHVAQEKKIGIKNEVYMVRVFSATGEAVLYKNNDTLDNLSASFVSEKGYVWYDYGSTYPAAAAEGCVGFTVVINENHDALKTILSDWVEYYKQLIGDEMKIIRVR